MTPSSSRRPPRRRSLPAGATRPRPRRPAPPHRPVRALLPRSAAPSGATGGTVLDEVASGVQFQTTTLEAPGGQPFSIKFDNQDASIPHNIQIADGSGKNVFEGDTINGVNTITYSVPALTAGTYKFSCKWHPNMVGDLTIK